MKFCRILISVSIHKRIAFKRKPERWSLDNEWYKRKLKRLYDDFAKKNDEHF